MSEPNAEVELDSEEGDSSGNVAEEIDSSGKVADKKDSSGEVADEEKDSTGKVAGEEKVSESKEPEGVPSLDEQEDIEAGSFDGFDEDFAADDAVSVQEALKGDVAVEEVAAHQDVPDKDVEAAYPVWTHGLCLCCHVSPKIGSKGSSTGKWCKHCKAELIAAQTDAEEKKGRGRRHNGDVAD